MNLKLIFSLSLVIVSLSETINASNIEMIGGHERVESKLKCEFAGRNNNTEDYLLNETLNELPILEKEQALSYDTNQGKAYSSAIVSKPSRNMINGEFKSSGKATNIWNGTNGQTCHFGNYITGRYEIQFEKPNTEYIISASWTGQTQPNTFNETYYVQHLTNIRFSDGEKGGQITGDRGDPWNMNTSGAINFEGISKTDNITLYISSTSTGASEEFLSNHEPYINNFNLVWSIKTVSPIDSKCIVAYTNNGMLNIPCVTVPTTFGSVMYKAEMKLVSSSDSLSFQLTESQQKEEPLENIDNCMAIYLMDGSLNIPCVTVPEESGGTVMYQADLQSISSTNSLVFKLIGAQRKE